ncbi:EXS-domain-containing protein [Xylaria sp. CBS 124048]|nr:EXS-domain-containing protein [Xylaria sp. CBS 124048]
MKFAKELEQDLVPEWRIKYLNYKAGKKYIKGVIRAIQRTNATPKSIGGRHDHPPHEAPSFFRPFSNQQENRRENAQGHGHRDVPLPSPAAFGPGAPPASTNLSPSGERQALSTLTENEANNHGADYGSIGPTARAASRLSKLDSRRTFELPDPALHFPPSAPYKEDDLGDPLSRTNSIAEPNLHQDAFVNPPARSKLKWTGFSHPTSLPVAGRFRRLFSHAQQLERTDSVASYTMQSVDLVRQREREFFDFLDSELDKVETFYRQKEVHAEQRLNALREQLHEMRNRRTYELAERRRRKQQQWPDGVKGSKGEPLGLDGHLKWIAPLKSKIFKPGANSKALAKMPQTPIVGAMAGDARRDYIRKPQEQDVPYRTAKHKLKLALQEFYRSLELLKSYALLNRTAFRKLNKKYDKAVNARPPLRYMNEKVNKAWFVNSEAIDGQIRSVEDLYARYFEKGNHKIAAGKLRRSNRRPRDESTVSFWNGLSIGVGAVFSIQGLVYGGQLLFDPDPTIRLQTSYLMQIYGGYFLMLLLFSLFCLNCYFWTIHKINYPFIFEFEPQNHLDWRQLACFPSFFLMLFGVFFWLNFTRYGHDELWLYYPVILIFVSLLIIFFPAPIMWHKSRKWLAYSHFRLFFAGLYPVEFRDFFLGDIYCSLTYAVSNIELFFCLYGQYWKNPQLCNSNHSRLLGFFSTLPAIWRALQCIRRYHDTKNVFPHLVNCGKYIMTILSYVTLSLYRIQNTHSNLALFITFSTINAIYTSVWDLFMDFSLLQPDSRHRLLRDIIGLKRRWLYYTIMIIDPILRFSWIFYAIFTHSVQHSTLNSFFVSFAEVIRRGMWALLRVENEHCSNVAQYKASRDTPLPYDLPHEPLMDRTSAEEEPSPELPEEQQQASIEPGLARVPTQNMGIGRVDSRASTYASAPMEEGGLRRRRTSLARAKSIRGIMATAHRQDFEKKRRPPAAVETEDVLSGDEFQSGNDEEEDVEDELGRDAAERLNREETLASSETGRE